MFLNKKNQKKNHQIVMVIYSFRLFLFPIIHIASPAYPK